MAFIYSTSKNYHSFLSQMHVIKFLESTCAPQWFLNFSNQSICYSRY